MTDNLKIKTAFINHGKFNHKPTFPDGVTMINLAKIMTLSAIVSFVIAAGCGYTPVYYSKGVKNIAVPIFDNQTLWRGYEFELTNLVQNEIISKMPNYRIVSKNNDADIVIYGTITSLSKPVVTEGELDRTIQSQLAMTVNIVVRNRRDSKVLFQGNRTETEPFTGQRSENEDSAKRAVYEKLARWVTNVLGNQEALK
ncbi:MAG: LptE family protein [Planctomycetes bacterium]|nr:LptE family protein [Planctomycetota bacterium]